MSVLTRDHCSVAQRRYESMEGIIGTATDVEMTYLEELVEIMLLTFLDLMSFLLVWVYLPIGFRLK